MPSFVIIGAQKSASTLLHAYVGEHPDVYIPHSEITAFEDPDYHAGELSRLQRLVASAPPAATVGIRRPDYLGKAECPLRIRRHIPDARLIAILRDPVKRAVSAYYYYMREGLLPVRDPERGLADILDGFTSTRYPRAQEIISYGYYHKHLMRYRQHFEDRQLRIMLQEDFVADVPGSLRRTYDFIGVNSRFRPHFQGEVKAGLYSLPRLRYRAATRPLTRRYNADRTRCYPRKGGLPNAVLAVDTHVLARIFRESGTQVSTRLVRRLRDRYAEDVGRLSALLGRDLSRWMRPS
jgi:hypothetical protein